jgi:hypothetical protein
MLMTKQQLSSDYFDWMIYKIRDTRSMHGQTHRYKQLLDLLHRTPFTYLMPMDENRYIDGLELRYRYAESTGKDFQMVNSYLKNEQCSVLEMMVALALRCEEHIMDNPAKGNRISVWFWNMIDSLRLDSMIDRQFDEMYANSKIYAFLNRDYKSNGDGSLFTVRNPKQDMKDIEIWYQACLYLNEFNARRENR